MDALPTPPDSDVEDIKDDYLGKSNKKIVLSTKK
jgi:hypothetical protein